MNRIGIYLIPDDQTVFKAVASEVPIEDGSLYFYEKEYPAEISFYRRDMNGGLVPVKSTIENREELLEFIEATVKFCYTNLCIWDIKENSEFSEDVEKLLNAAYEYGKQIHMDTMDELHGVLREDEVKTYEQCLAHVQDGASLYWIPSEHITEEICKIAFDNAASEFEYIPDKFKDYELCLLAVQRYPGNVEHLPKQFETQELYHEALVSGIKGWDVYAFAIAYMYFPEDILEKELASLDEKGKRLLDKYIEWKKEDENDLPF